MFFPQIETLQNIHYTVSLSTENIVSWGKCKSLQKFNTVAQTSKLFMNWMGMSELYTIVY